MVTKDGTEIEMICGKPWRKVDGRLTTAGPTFTREEIERCGGYKPWIITVDNSTDESD